MVGHKRTFFPCLLTAIMISYTILMLYVEVRIQPYTQYAVLLLDCQLFASIVGYIGLHVNWKITKEVLFAVHLPASLFFNTSRWARHQWRLQLASRAFLDAHRCLSTVWGDSLNAWCLASPERIFIVFTLFNCRTYFIVPGLPCFHSPLFLIHHFTSYRFNFHNPTAPMSPPRDTIPPNSSPSPLPLSHLGFLQTPPLARAGDARAKDQRPIARASAWCATAGARRRRGARSYRRRSWRRCSRSRRAGRCWSRY